MRAWSLVLFLLLSPWASAQVEDTEEAYKTVAFVGRLISIRPLPDPCEGEQVGWAPGPPLLNQVNCIASNPAHASA